MPDTATPPDRPQAASPAGPDTVGAAATTPAAPAATPAPPDLDATGSNRVQNVVPTVIGVDSMGNSSGAAPPAAAPDVTGSGATAPAAGPAPAGGAEDAPLPPSFENGSAPSAPPSP
ncbi:MAG: hypothetical protein ACJ8F1_17525 [Polyangia bacterium]